MHSDIPIPYLLGSPSNSSQPLFPPSKSLSWFHIFCFALVFIFESSNLNRDACVGVEVSIESWDSSATIALKIMIPVQL